MKVMGNAGCVELPFHRTVGALATDNWRTPRYVTGRYPAPQAGASAKRHTITVNEIPVPEGQAMIDLVLKRFGEVKPDVSLEVRIQTINLKGSKREADVAVSGLSGLAGKRVTVYINGKRIGTMLISRRGRAEREWSTARRQYVPLAGSGSPVRVRTASGTLIVSGMYHRQRD